jgi:hypothetical protein
MTELSAATVTRIQTLATYFSPDVIAGMLRNEATPIRISTETVKRIIRERREAEL